MATAEHLWITDYYIDVHHHLRSKEQKRPAFLERSPLLHLRRYIVTWISNICQKLSICRIVQHMAIYLLDFFMDSHTVPPEKLHLLASGCILVAAKLEEKDEFIPKISTLRNFSDNSYSPYAFLSVELQLLEYFEWDLLMPTSAHFMDYYIVFALSPTDSCLDNEIESFETAKQLMEKYAGYFLDITLNDHKFLTFAPSLIAASCIAASRMCLILSPLWPAFLQKLTTYSMEQLNPCLSIMLRILDDEEERSRNASHKAM